MYIINLHNRLSGLYRTYIIDENDDLNEKLSKFEERVKEELLTWYEDDYLKFRFEVIDTQNEDIRNIIWKSKKGFLEACSIEKYVRHLINKETYQIWITDYENDGSICKFAN
jgi:hypothetical protein